MQDLPHDEAVLQAEQHPEPSMPNVTCTRRTRLLQELRRRRAAWLRFVLLQYRRTAAACMRCVRTPIPEAAHRRACVESLASIEAAPLLSIRTRWACALVRSCRGSQQALGDGTHSHVHTHAARTHSATHPNTHAHGHQSAARACAHACTYTRTRTRICARTHACTCKCSHTRMRTRTRPQVLRYCSNTKRWLRRAFSAAPVAASFSLCRSHSAQLRVLLSLENCFVVRQIVHLVRSDGKKTSFASVQPHVQPAGYGRVASRDTDRSS